MMRSCPGLCHSPVAIAVDLCRIAEEDTIPVFELFLKLIVPANNQVLGIHRFVVIQSSRNLSDID